MGDDPLEIDALVVGGGVQGLWLLRTMLAKKYRVLLVDSLPHDAAERVQSLHTQGFVYRGYFYGYWSGMRGPALAMSKAWTSWDALLTELDVDRDPSVTLRVSEEDEKEFASWQMWRSGHLPEIERGTDGGWSTEEVVIPDCAKLLGDFWSALAPYAHSGRLEPFESWESRQAITLSLETTTGTQTLRIAPKILVFTAGVWGDAQVTP